MARKRARKRTRKSKAHPGFKAVQGQIARKQGVSKERAGAMLAAGTRRAGAAARRRNPRLKRVKGKAKPKRRAKTATKRRTTKRRTRK